MKTKKIKKVKQKIIIPIIILLLFNFIMPNYSQASIYGVIASPVIGLVALLGDAVNRIIYTTIGSEEDDSQLASIIGVGEYEIYLNNDEDKKEYIEAHPADDSFIQMNKDDMILDYGIPNIRITPAEIFSNSISMLNANFFLSSDEINDQEGSENRSVVATLKGTISSWYNTLRIISLVGLLSVLVYIGIRVIISSTAADKAKYKERLKDWLVAMCLIFFLHYIMVFIMTAVDQVTELIANSTGTTDGIAEQINIQIVDSSGNVDEIDGVPVQFATNLTGYMRLSVEAEDLIPKLSAVIMYLALTFYTIYFVFIYLKRLLTLIFLTLIAPLVALTYPLDKIRDGKAQAFNYWLREYTINAMLPIIHLILYTILITSAIDLVKIAPLYAIVALAFIIPAEKIVKEMFGFKSGTAPGSGFAGGVMASQALSALAKRGHRGGNSSSNNSSDTSNSKIKTYGDKGKLDSNYSDLSLEARAGASTTASASATATIEDKSKNKDDDDDKDNPAALYGVQLAQAQHPEVYANQNNNNEANDDNDDDDNPAALYGAQMAQAQHPEAYSNSNDEGNTMGNRDEMLMGGLRDFRQNLADEQIKEKEQKREKRRNIKNNALKMAKRRFNATSGKDLAAKKAIAAGKKAAKAGIRAAGVATGATVGLAAGMVSGDMSDMWKGLAGGAVAGNLLGKNASNRIDNFDQEIKQQANKVKDFKNELLYGDEAAAREAMQRDFANNADNIRYMKEKHPEINSSKEITEYLKSMSVYQDVTDGDLKKMDKLYDIENSVMSEQGVSKEQAQKYAHQIGKLSKNYDISYFNDADKKQKAIETNKNRLMESGLNEEQAQTQAETIMEQIRKYNGYYK